MGWRPAAQGDLQLLARSDADGQRNDLRFGLLAEPSWAALEPQGAAVQQAMFAAVAIVPIADRRGMPWGLATAAEGAAPEAGSCLGCRAAYRGVCAYPCSRAARADRRRHSQARLETF